MKKLGVLLLLISLPTFAGWRVFWKANDVAEEVTSYRVWLLRPPFSLFVPIADVKGTNYIFPVTALSTNGVHAVYITAVNAIGESLPSLTVQFTNGVAQKLAPSRVVNVGIVYEP